MKNKNSLYRYILLLLVVLLYSSLKPKESLVLLEVFQRKYTNSSVFYGEVYVKWQGQKNPTQKTIQKACIEIIPQIADEIKYVKFHIVEDKKVTSRFSIRNEYTGDTTITFTRTDSVNTWVNKRLNELIAQELWDKPDSIISLWTKDQWWFECFYKENGVVKIENYFYDGIKLQNKYPQLELVTINNQKYYKNVWQTDLFGPEDHYHQINTYGDIVIYEPFGFMLEIIEKVKID